MFAPDRVKAGRRSLLSIKNGIGTLQQLLIFKFYNINFDIEEHYKKCGMMDASFVEVLDYSFFKSIDHCLK